MARSVPLTSDQVYDTLKYLSNMETAYLDFKSSRDDVDSMRFYYDYVFSKSLREQNLGRFYWPIDLTTSPHHNVTRVSEINSLRAEDQILPGFDFSISKLCNFPVSPMHSCDYFTLVCFLSGNGELNLPRSHHGLREGDFYLVPSDVPYALHSQPDSICICMDIRHSFMISSHHTLFMEDTRIINFISQVISAPGEELYAAFHTRMNDQIRSLLCQIFAEYLNHDEYSLPAMRNNLMLLMIAILRNPEVSWESSAGHIKQDNQFRQIMYYIHQHYQTATLSDLAETLHFSKQHICRIIHMQSGSTFQALLNEVRLDMTRQFLAESNFSMGDIAYLCGFSEASNMTRLFKKHFGFTPIAYRRKVQQEKEA